MFFGFGVVQRKAVANYFVDQVAGGLGRQSWHALMRRTSTLFALAPHGDGELFRLAYFRVDGEDPIPVDHFTISPNGPRLRFFRGL